METCDGGCVLGTERVVGTGLGRLAQGEGTERGVGTEWVRRWYGDGYGGDAGLGRLAQGAAAVGSVGGAVCAGR